MVGRFRKDHNPYAIPGVPDLILIDKGRFIGLEIKSSTGRQSEGQKAFQEKLTKAGGQDILVRSLEDVKLVLRDL